MVRVTPLLNVHRTEEQLKLASDELQMLRSKLEKYENERNALKTDNSRLELKVCSATLFICKSIDRVLVQEHSFIYSFIFVRFFLFIHCN